jgi:UDP-N-acetylglucosamine diphosphorylase / glucose-1-phosphate thymidylyltransferase / UDP-N-acetylgalactosamine diphosphorylase / glucosamine-1-phosphate N-acetyltransferase / galactosamine-1-phosphate N-acetyltransferase
VNSLVLYDDATARRFEPFSLTRPVSELRAGTEIVRRRWELALDAEATAFVGAAHLADYEEADAPGMLTGDIAAGTILVHSRFAITMAPSDPWADVWTCDGRVAAVRIGRTVSANALRDGGAALDAFVAPDATSSDVSGWWLNEVWDLIRHLPEMIASDITQRVERLDTVSAAETGAAIIGAHPARVERGAAVEPYVVFDASAGPILVRRGATISPFTRLVGPCYVGEESIIAGGKVAATSVGEQCRVHGEVSNTVFLGHANKSHDGFVGHSYLGRWSNLGASTVTSNLKNTYGPVSLWTPNGVRSTGMQFLGTFLGDHAKTAIGTRLTTGSVIGAGANVFATSMTPKVVAPFSWGGASDTSVYEIDRFLNVAERVMIRRHVVLVP